MLSGRILVVDDDPDVATLVEETLTAEAYEVVHTGAVGAQRLARELRPDVILLDYAMPELDGAEVSRRLRADHTDAGDRYATAVSLTALGGAVREVCEAALKAGRPIRWAEHAEAIAAAWPRCREQEEWREEREAEEWRELERRAAAMGVRL